MRVCLTFLLLRRKGEVGAGSRYSIVNFTQPLVVKAAKAEIAVNRIKLYIRTTLSITVGTSSLAVGLEKALKTILGKERVVFHNSSPLRFHRE